MLNQRYFNHGPNTWNSDTIRQRAAELAGQILEIWPALGDVPEPKGWQERPKFLTILGETAEMKSWRDVLEKTAECAIQISDDFESVAQVLPGYFSKAPFQNACRQLSNGWWLYVNLSSDSVKRACDTLIEAVGIPEEEFELELW